jgi:tetratricopeptide (TPR) repeat protein
MTDVKPSGPTPNASRSKTYFLLGTAFMAVMGLVWSVDDSFIYFAFAFAVYFFFMGFYTRPQATGNNYSKHQTKNQTGDSDFETLFKSFTQQSGSRSTTRPASTPGTNIGKIIGAIFTFMFFGFFVVVFAVIFFADDETTAGYFDIDTAEAFRQSGQYDSAEVYYQKVLTKDPENDNALAGYGFVFYAREKYEEAERYFNKALDRNQDNTEARYGKGLIYFNRKSYSESAKQARIVLSSNPNDEDGLLLAGDSYYLQNRYDSALFFYETGYANGIRTAGLSHVMAYIYDTQKKYDKAIPLYQEAISFDESRTDIYTRLGELIPGPEGEQYRVKAREANSQSN